MNIKKYEYILLVLIIIGSLFYIILLVNKEEKSIDFPILEEEIIEPSLPIMNCPNINTKDDNWRDNIIIIDPGSGYKEEDIGFFNKEEPSFNELRVATELTDLLTVHKNIISTKSNTPSSLKQRINKIITNNGELIISLHVGNNDNLIRAYYSGNSEKAEESKKLACKIINKIFR